MITGNLFNAFLYCEISEMTEHLKKADDVATEVIVAVLMFPRATAYPSDRVRL